MSQNIVANPRAELENWLLQQVRQLDELTYLPPNWNSYGAEPPNAIALLLTIALYIKQIRQLSQQIEAF
ncbi:MAG: hypothetical protein NW220_18635 [Leptolyngbyaceae cyanobacterium bins.349]|nr:hypothetical protein [Leptolyngbyaceae cyanobacterium bins.349]